MSHPTSTTITTSTPIPSPAAARPTRRPHAPTPPDAGMTTAEYAVGTLAACAFAGILFTVVNSGAVVDALTALVVGALNGGQ
ncbi:DUF4244 domain-containing protein [Allostreptomyces psammosilenae]|uniref:DUF4244 domain-containing protein n=1 Tax=Allostreptomyces psammosilenae TaxID=1892865 RepID=A0A853A533_9ACTN|nr:DUF4244 domain-containing protein [Allostreptomyces psammosilenae]NYI05618.1 hypothetical protein [Allostreptomyces psammosilenae]